MNKIILLCITVILFSRCNALKEKEIARLELNHTSNDSLVIAEETIDVKKGDKIAFWDDLKIQFEGDLMLVFTIEIWKDSIKIGSLRLDALKTNPKLMEVKTQFGNSTKWSFIGRMKYIEIDEDATYKFRAAINSNDNSTLVIHKADLILKK